jgi:hypothetical protein
MNQKELLQNAPAWTEIKNINRVTYIRHKDVVLEIKGPYRPGSVWKLEYYKVKPEFDQAWDEEKLTSVQRSECTRGMDQIVAAMTLGSPGMIAYALYTENRCLGYTYSSKGEAMGSACHVLNNGLT